MGRRFKSSRPDQISKNDGQISLLDRSVSPEWLIPQIALCEGFADAKPLPSNPDTYARALKSGRVPGRSTNER